MKAPLQIPTAWTTPSPTLQDHTGRLALCTLISTQLQMMVRLLYIESNRFRDSHWIFSNLNLLVRASVHAIFEKKTLNCMYVFIRNFQST
jgi:hypothetical protein